MSKGTMHIIDVEFIIATKDDTGPHIKVWVEHDNPNLRLLLGYKFQIKPAVGGNLFVSEEAQITMRSQGTFSADTKEDFGKIPQLSQTDLYSAVWYHAATLDELADKDKLFTALTLCNQGNTECWMDITCEEGLFDTYKVKYAQWRRELNVSKMYTGN